MNNDQDDIVIEEEPEQESSFKANKDARFLKLEEELEKCRKEKQEYLDGWQRSKADYINFKKRSEQEKINLMAYAKEDLILELIKIADHFELAFKDKNTSEKNSDNWRKGIEQIYSSLKLLISDQGITEINPLGEEFNPLEHDAVENVETENKENDHKIIEVVQKGYKMKDKIVRHAVVKVGQVKE